jgi:hypothetical protein
LEGEVSLQTLRRGGYVDSGWTRRPSPAIPQKSVINHQAAQRMRRATIHSYNNNIHYFFVSASQN